MSRRTSCRGCPKRHRCTRICPDIERLLPPENGGTDFDFDPVDRQVAWKIQDHEDELPWPDRDAARLHFRFGWTQAEIARELGYSQMHISRILLRIRKRILG